jgi:hypothetical protein
MTRLLSRRALFASTALAGIGLAAATRRAAALSIEAADVQSKRLYLSACSSADSATHEKLVAEIEARLQGASRSEIEQAIQRTVCPICGCPLVAP